MTEYVSLKKKDLLEVWEETKCEELAEALKLLYPDDLPPRALEPKETDISTEVKWEMVLGGTGGGCFLEGFYKGEQITFVNPSDNYDKEAGVGVRIAWGAKGNYKMQWCAGHTFKIIKTG